jgi:acetylornithine deacetylase
MSLDTTRDAAAARVLDEVDALTEEMVALISALVRIPSVGGSDAEHEAQAWFAEVLVAGGLEVDHWRIPLDELAAEPDFPGMEVARAEAWGLVGRLPGSRPADARTLLLDGHIDVVPPGDVAAWSRDPFSGEITGDVHTGVLHGRGACDMKAGLVAAHWAVQAVRRSGTGLGGDLLLASVQGEEDGGLGTYATLRRGWTADACVIPEPTNLDVVPANAGALTFRLRIRGQATHAASRLAGVSAIEKLWPVWQAIQALEHRREGGHDHPISLGTVHAGDWASSVPDLLVAEGRMGVALDETVEQAEAALEAAVAAACAADPWLRDHPAEVEWWGGRFASGRLPEGSDLADRVQQAHRTATGGAANDVRAVSYGSDLRLLVNQGDIPTVQYGPGDVGVAHGPHEHVRLADVAATARTLALLALDVGGR